MCIDAATWVTSSNGRLVLNMYIATVSWFTIMASLMMIKSGRILNETTYCDDLLLNAYNIMGGIACLVSVIAFVGLCFKAPKIFCVYMVVMFFIIILFFATLVFIPIAYKDRGAGKKLLDRDYKEYRLEEYSSLLRKMFINNENKWNKIQRCLIRKNVCSTIHTVYGTTPTFDEFRAMPFSAVQSGCCMPAKECDFEYVSPFVWKKTTSGSSVVTNSSINADCALWDDHDASNHYCFNCSSCKAGYIDNLNNGWRQEFDIQILLFLFMVLIYSIGCGVLWIFVWEMKQFVAGMELVRNGTSCLFV